MTATGTTRCPRCGTARTTDAAWSDICPACLLTTALSMEDEPCPYQVLAPIAEDSRGVTYLAQRLAGARRYVALEILAPRDDIGDVLSRYQRWKPVLDRFQHANFGRLLQVGLTTPERLYVASEYVAGWPLTALESRGPVGIAVRMELARQVVGAICAAHAADLVHLKLEPSTVKFSTGNKAHATIVGLGSRLIVDGAEAKREQDIIALVHLVRGLGVALPERQYETVAAIEDALSE